MNDIEEVKSRLDIVEVVQAYVPGLRRAGRSYKANCPFHHEDTPSFVVTPEMQIYKCFGCGEGGDVLKFIQQIERVDFGEALQIAADKAGYELKGSVQKDKQLDEEKSKIYAVNELAAKFWHYLLKTHKSGKAGRDFMQQRQLRIEEVERFQLGYAPPGDNLCKFLASKGYKQQDLVKWGLAIEKNGSFADKFRNRFMMPIYNIKGDVIGFSGRIIGKSDFAPKYLNSPETPVYIKGENLLCMYQAKEAARKQDFLILVEGNIDPLSSCKVGIENIAATGGTALTEQQCKLIKRYAEHVYFAFDSDSAGIKALSRGIELAERVGLKHKVLDFGDFQDPDELIKHDPNAWKQVVENPINSVDHLIRIFQKDLDLGSADGKSEFFARILPVLKSLRDQIQLDHFIERTALLVGATKEVVREAMSTGLRAPQSSVKEEAHQTEPLSHEPTNARELFLIALLLKTNSPEVTNQITEDVFSDVNIKEIFSKLSQQTESIDIVKFSGQLSDGGAETLLEAMATNIPSENIEKEIKNITMKITGEILRSQILSLREKLKNSPEDPLLLQQLAEYTKKLSQTGRTAQI